MKKLILAAVAAASTSFAGANAAIIDFAAYADTFGERGVDPSETLTIGGVALQAFGFADDGATPAFAYLDRGNAGLGVCQNLATINGVADQCSPGNDDNVTAGETLIIAFEDILNITDLLFRQADHSVVTGGNVIVTTDTLSGTFTLADSFANIVAAANSGDLAFQDVFQITFDFVDTQFYISSIETPLPAALPLLLSGVAGLGFASRRRKTTA